MFNIAFILSIVFLYHYKFYCVANSVYFRGTCPRIKTVENFNLSAYCTGIWYEVARYANDMENNGECVYTEASFENGNCFVVSREKVNGENYILEGQFTPAPNTSGIMYLHSPNATIIEDNFPMFVVDIDYTNFAFLYRCVYNETTKSHHDYLWVQARAKNIEGPVKAKVDEAMKAMSYLDTAKFTWTHFSDEYCKSKP